MDGGDNWRLGGSVQMRRCEERRFVSAGGEAESGGQ